MIKEIICTVCPRGCRITVDGENNKINSIEQHNRRCYGGYIAIHNNEDISAYVNIRCAQFDKKTYCIYSGGGITKDSNPIEEWKETENKISTLKRIFHETM